MLWRSVAVGVPHKLLRCYRYSRHLSILKLNNCAAPVHLFATPDQGSSLGHFFSIVGLTPLSKMCREYMCDTYMHILPLIGVSSKPAECHKGVWYWEKRSFTLET